MIELIGYSVQKSGAAPAFGLQRPSPIVGPGPATIDLKQTRRLWIESEVRPGKRRDFIAVSVVLVVLERWTAGGRPEGSARRALR